ncbi:hypothetical protein ILYODFUR_002710, partial [Ilyodon furcidens]
LQAAYNRFMVLYLAPFILPSTLSFQVPAEEKHLHSMMLPLPCFPMMMIILSLTYGWHVGQKVYIWVDLTRAPLICVCCVTYIDCSKLKLTCTQVYSVALFSFRGVRARRGKNAFLSLCVSL